VLCKKKRKNRKSTEEKTSDERETNSSEINERRWSEELSVCITLCGRKWRRRQQRDVNERGGGIGRVRRERERYLYFYLKTIQFFFSFKLILGNAYIRV
jgi:hypothetical protein